MIGVDWGTSRFRAFRLTAAGAIRDHRASGRGVLAVADGRFADTLREEIGPWLAAGERHVLICGMAGSRQGWLEAPYLPCPAGPADLVAALTEVPFDWAEVRLVPGLAGTDPEGVAEVMRGEETQLAGALPEIARLGAGVRLACLPGTHSKWVRLEQERILDFATHMTGEAFAALRGHTILGRTMSDGAATDLAAFDRGLARAAQPGGLLHHLFGVRAEALAGRLAAAAGASYLSGLLIGHETRAALKDVAAGAVVPVIGAPELTALYARAIAAAGHLAERIDGAAVARGLARIGALAGWA
ncbi:MAG: 2-dehydro-3-deoxygalactonokinase [Acetobacteraceae bacterium]